MSVGGDDGTKHNVNSSLGGSCNDSPPSKSFTVHDASTSVCMNGPSLEIVSSFSFCGTSVGKVRVSGFGLRLTETSVQDCEHVSSEACCLVPVGVAGSDNSHEAGLSFHAIFQIPRILDASTVLMMSTDKCVKEDHHHSTNLEASQEHPGDHSWK